jgi:hypothetical protein
VNGLTQCASAAGRQPPQVDHSNGGCRPVCCKRWLDRCALAASIDSSITELAIGEAQLVDILPAQPQAIDQKYAVGKI